jgi:hypothetical protein
MISKRMSRDRAYMLSLAAIMVLLLASGANSQESFSAKMVEVGKIEIEIATPLKGSVDDPAIHVFEIVRLTPTTTKTFERTPLSVNRRLVSGRFMATIAVPPPVAGFDHYEVEVRNYLADTEPESFRAGVYGITAAITNATGREVEVTFRGLNTIDWKKLRTWIAATAATGSAVTVTLGNGETRTLNVTHASHIEFAPLCPRLKPAERFTECSLIATLALDGRFPVGEAGKVRLTFPPGAFTGGTADGLPLEIVRAGVGAGKVSDTRQVITKDRDPIRTNVVEAGGSLNTSIKLDPDPTKNEAPKRETKGSADLRLAAPTRTFADSGRAFSTWTPVEYDAQVSTGKLNGDSLSTNTMRVFTQVQRVYAVDRRQGIDFFRLVGEGGAAADRDLRIIEYTGRGDFRYNPAFLNRVLDRNPTPELGNRIKVELTPFGFEFGRRQVRRDPIFIADDFVRRFRFAAKMDLEFPPYVLFQIENRSWWRGEVNENRFKNYFTTALTLTPSNANASAGIYLSYERGSLPPFTTQRVSAFKVGVRFRRKEW